ncbi:MAG: ParA family protein [Oscillospiraceae bacterium]|nr:ParA family protein [Oscillospiraceae bacterium]MBR2422033.1 ParA family protein [Oscillospiraceae bacterium]
MSIRTTAILNLKGGVAKTTTAINMAAILAEKHRNRVLLIDADSQCNTTEFFGVDPTGSNLADVLRGAGYYDDPGAYAASRIQNTQYEHIDLLPGDDTLMDMDLSKVEQGAVNSNVLRYLVEEVKERYDYILIDCPPAFNAASAAALIAADDVIIPIKLDAFSLRGMGNLMRQIKNMRRINPRLKLAGCLPTMWYKDPQIQEAEQQLKAAGLSVFHHIRRSDKVDKMTFQQEALLISSPNSAAGVDYRKFVAEYVRRK